MPRRFSAYSFQKIIFSFSSVTVIATAEFSKIV